MEPWITAGATVASALIGVGFGAVLTRWTQAADAEDRRRDRLREALRETRVLLVDAVPADTKRVPVASGELSARWDASRPKLATALMDADSDLREALSVVSNQTNATLLQVAATAGADDDDLWRTAYGLATHHQLRAFEAVDQADKLTRPSQPRWRWWRHR